MRELMFEMWEFEFAPRTGLPSSKDDEDISPSLQEAT